MRVAILHYWFLLRGGGESVVDALLEMFPAADVFCLFAEKDSLPRGLPLARLRCSRLANFPFAQRFNRAIFPLYAGAVGSFDFTGYDLIISSDSPPIKDIVTPIDTLHISYCHTPGRFIWDLAPRFTAQLPWLIRGSFAHIAARARTNDYVAAQRVTQFVANSYYVKKRIAHYYGRDAAVIYPPVDTGRGYIANTTDDYYLSVSRLVETKKIDILIAACNTLNRRLLIVGTGREEKRLKSLAGPSITFLGRVPDQQLTDYYARCRALLFAADEDFGIVPIEAQSFGRPVIAYGHGGSLETVRVGSASGLPDTGLLFSEQTPGSVIDAIRRFESNENRFCPGAIRSHALKFDKSAFMKQMSRLISDCTQGDMLREVAVQ
jgi:glycosyltransferase involved in cell wall biosynthesis